MASVTRLDYISKVFKANFLSKEAQTCGKILDHFEKGHFLSKHCFGYFLGNFWKELDAFYTNIWSHWLWLSWHVVTSDTRGQCLESSHLNNT